MSSLIRRIQRRLRNRNEVQPNPHKLTKTHFYALHPTKGWRKISLKRVALGMSMTRGG